MRKTTEVQSRSRTLQLQQEISEKWRDRLTLTEEERQGEYSEEWDQEGAAGNIEVRTLVSFG